jgi:hypothetical protein
MAEESRFVVSPYELEQRSEEVASLVDACQNVAANQVQHLMLGDSPPALKFSQLLADLSGEQGAVGLLNWWADGLRSMGVCMGEAASDYRAVDDNCTAAIRGVDDGAAG